MQELDALVEQAERGGTVTAADMGALLLALGAVAFDVRSGAAGASLANMLRQAGERLVAPPQPAEPVPAEPAAEPEASAAPEAVEPPRAPKATTRKRR